MKIYARTKSDKDSKSANKGGNAYIETEYFLGNRNVAKVKLVADTIGRDDKGCGVVLVLFTDETPTEGSLIHSFFPNTSSEKRQESVCYCDETDLSVPHLNIDH